jgi:hypothetical protein
LDLLPAKNVGFEVKSDGRGGKFARAKENTGDITMEVETAGVVGSIGRDYENFKNYGEYYDHGLKVLTIYWNLQEDALMRRIIPAPLLRIAQ